MLLHRKHLMRRRGRRRGRNIFGGEAEKLKQFHGVGLRAASTAVLWSLRSLPYSSWRRHHWLGADWGQPPGEPSQLSCLPNGGEPRVHTLPRRSTPLLVAK